MLYIIPKASSTFKLPEDFRSLWPFNNNSGWVIHSTRVDTEECQVSVVHFREYPFVNHLYGEVAEMPERARAVREIFAGVKMANVTNHTSGECVVCRQPWYLIYHPLTGRPVTVHAGLASERRCAMLASITRGAKP